MAKVPVHRKYANIETMKDFSSILHTKSVLLKRWPITTVQSLDNVVR